MKPRGWTACSCADALGGRSHFRVDDALLHRCGR